MAWLIGQSLPIKIKVNSFTWKVGGIRVRLKLAKKIGFAVWSSKISIVVKSNFHLPWWGWPWNKMHLICMMVGVGYCWATFSILHLLFATAILCVKVCCIMKVIKFQRKALITVRTAIRVFFSNKSCSLEAWKKNLESPQFLI